MGRHSSSMTQVEARDPSQRFVADEDHQKRKYLRAYQAYSEATSRAIERKRFIKEGDVGPRGGEPGAERQDSIRFDINSRAVDREEMEWMSAGAIENGRELYPNRHSCRYILRPATCKRQGKFCKCRYHLNLHLRLYMSCVG